MNIFLHKNILQINVNFWMVNYIFYMNFKYIFKQYNILLSKYLSIYTIINILGGFQRNVNFFYFLYEYQICIYLKLYF